MHAHKRSTLAAGLTSLLALLLVVPATQAQPDAEAQTDGPTKSANEAEIGAPAPGFSLTDTDGDTHSLSDYEGKYVVLEWVDFRCPYVGKHYGSGHMQKLQEKYTEKGVVWLSMYSASPKHPAYFSPEKMAAKNKELGGDQTAILMDSSGEVGKTYGATNTPHMFVINPEGELIYKGGIDNKPTTDEADIKTAKNYVEAALSQAMNGKDVSVKTAQPYGCPIKYGK